VAVKQAVDLVLHFEARLDPRFSADSLKDMADGSVFDFAASRVLMGCECAGKTICGYCLARKWRDFRREVSGLSCRIPADIEIRSGGAT
jgi:hypothetical protein